MFSRIGAVALLAVLFLVAVFAVSPDALAFGDRLQVTMVRLSVDGTATPLLPGQNATPATVPMPNPPPGSIVGNTVPLPGENYTNDVRGGDCSGSSSSSYSYRASSSSVNIVGDAGKREARRKGRHVERTAGFSAGVVGAYSGASGAPTTGNVVSRSKSVERYRD